MDKLRFLFTVLLCICLPFVVLANDKVILVTNPTSHERSEIVRIEWADFKNAFPDYLPGNFKVLNKATKKEIPFQVAYEGKSSPQSLLLEIKIGRKQQLQFVVIKGNPSLFIQKTFARYVPERKDDFAWENDKIAFRMYGKALEQTNENGHGIDVWVKSTDRLIIDERYKRGNYHQDFGDGLDYYQVGTTLGAGNLAPFWEDKILYPGNYEKWEILDNGSLRTTFRLTYSPFKLGEDSVVMEKTISIDAGSQLNKIEVRFKSGSGIKSFPIVIGLSKRKQPGVVYIDEQNPVMAYWEPEMGENGVTGVGVVLMNKTIAACVDKDQFLLKDAVLNNNSYIYYTGAAWNKANEITSSASWFNYLINFRQNQLSPLTIKIE